MRKLNLLIVLFLQLLIVACSQEVVPDTTRSLFTSKEPLNTLPIYKSDSIVAYVVNYVGGGFTEVFGELMKSKMEYIF